MANTVSYTEMHGSLKSLALALPEGPHMVTGITQEKVANEFIGYSNEPWVIIEGNWWRLNPKRPDFHPRATSKLLANWGDPRELPSHDLTGNIRRGPAIGAFVARER